MTGIATEKTLRGLPLVLWTAGVALTWPLWYRGWYAAAAQLFARLHPTELMIGSWPPIEPRWFILRGVILAVAGFAAGFLGVLAPRLLSAPRLIWIAAAAMTAYVTIVLTLGFVHAPDATRWAVFFGLPAATCIVGAWMGSRVDARRRPLLAGTSRQPTRT